MFESAELGHKIDKATYREEVPALRAALLETQELLRANGSFPVIILISGVDGSGKGDTINALYEWMDPRYLSTHGVLRADCRRAARPYDVALLARAAAQRGASASSLVPGIRIRSPSASRRVLEGPISTSGWTSSIASRRCWSTKGRWSSSSGSTCQGWAAGAV
jgi:hypothetical protein